MKNKTISLFTNNYLDFIEMYLFIFVTEINYVNFNYLIVVNILKT